MIEYSKAVSQRKKIRMKIQVTSDQRKNWGKEEIREHIRHVCQLCNCLTKINEMLTPTNYSKKKPLTAWNQEKLHLSGTP